jgi:protein-L-isoaspartate(D-aspartate) O-methyltransferase
MKPLCADGAITRRHFVKVASASAFVAALPQHTRAEGRVPVPFSFTLNPPLGDRQDFIDWMIKNRGEDPVYLGQRWDRYLALVAHHDVWDDRNKRAYLLTPREDFVTAANLSRAYEWHYLDIGFGVTITGPHTVARMTNVIDVKQNDKVLEVGTGSGYQSAYLSHLTSKVWSIEIIGPLAERTRKLYDGLIQRGYSEFENISMRHSDGYYGWEENAPFDKIIVTCGIDHIPPPLLQQLKPNGLMVIPIGPPGAQHVLKITKTEEQDGSIRVARSDIYNGAVINFVPFTKLADGVASGRH